MSEEKLPKGWAWATLDDVVMRGFASITDGPFGSNLKTEHYVDAGPRVLRLQNIGDGQFVDEHAHISDAHFATLRKHEVIPGDVLIAMLGEVLPRSCLAPANVGPAIVKADCVRARVDPEIASAAYVSHALNCHQTRRRASSIVHGVGRPRLNLGEIRTLPIPIAPRSEQDRIAAAIEQHLSDVDAGVANIERALANLKRYRASVLKAACEGRLVPTEAELARKEKRDYEPADVLLRRILKERRARWEADQLARMKAKGQAPKDDTWKARYEEATPPVIGSLPDLPRGWCWASVAAIASREPSSITDGPFGSNLKTEHYVSEGPRVVRLQNIGDGRFLDERAHISEAHFNTLKKHEVVDNDLLVAALGETLPRACLAPKWLGSAIVKADCIRVRCDNGLVHPSYAMNALNADPTRKRVAERVHGVGRPRLNLGEIKAIELPLPPLAEQQRIVAEVDRLLSTADEIENTLRAQLARAARLRQAVLKRAFEGKLVPQDPNDEPASALLARLRAQQPAEPKRAARGRPRRAASNSEP